ncbi:MFS transporter [Thermoplasmatales archaeon AK]|nr:MFS transporter [Thermoplasmatales archaeon AK]
MVQYKWVALSNTTIGVLMASVNGTITLISLPAIFRGIQLSPLQPGSFVYLIWILMGFNIVTATLLVTFGRLSDIYGRVRLFNLGFAIFTLGSILLFITPGRGDTGALELVMFRIVQGIGAAFLFSNSAAILTDAFPLEERGKALGINQVAFLGGSFVGLILGGILSGINVTIGPVHLDWNSVFLVSVPIGLLGTVWSYLKLKETSRRDRTQKIDYVGNLIFAGGLTVALIAVTYGLLPYGSDEMGWGNPFVISGIVVGVALLALFPFVELKVKQPMFRMSLFKIRAFSAGNFASLLSSIGRGGVMFMLIILLQGIYLPLHGYSFESTPFWAGIYMLPMTAGFMVMGPLSGALSDRYGARGLATAGMAIVGSAFVALSLIPYDFNYVEFALIIFVMGLGNGMFAAPNTAAIMNSVPAETRGAASGMRSTLQNSGMTASMGIFFTIVLLTLSNNLPASYAAQLSTVPGLSASLISTLDRAFAAVPPTVALFSAFLGINPVASILSSNPSLASLIPSSSLSVMEGTHWFPLAIAPAFMISLHTVFVIGVVLSFLAAVVSAMRGKKYAAEGAHFVGTPGSGEERNIGSESDGKLVYVPQTGNGRGGAR